MIVTAMQKLYAIAVMTLILTGVYLLVSCFVSIPSLHTNHSRIAFS